MVTVYVVKIITLVGLIKMSKNLLAEHRITVKHGLIRLWSNGFDRVCRRTKFDDMPQLLETCPRKPLLK